MAEKVLFAERSTKEEKRGENLQKNQNSRRILASAMKYLYWVAYCKTVGCKSMRVVKFGGECVEGRPDQFQIVVPDTALILDCPACSKSSEYRATEIVAVVKNDPPPTDFVDLI